MSRAASASQYSLLKLFTISLILFSNFYLMAFSFCNYRLHFVSQSLSYFSRQQGSPLEWFSWSYISLQFLIFRFQFYYLSWMMFLSRMATLFLRLIFSLQSPLVMTHRSMETFKDQSYVFKCWLLGLVTRRLYFRQAVTFSYSTYLSIFLISSRMASLVMGYSYQEMFLASIFFIISVTMCLDFWFQRYLLVVSLADFSYLLLPPFSCRLWNFLSNYSIFYGPRAGLAGFSCFLASLSSFCLSNYLVRMFMTQLLNNSFCYTSSSSYSFFFLLVLMGTSAGSWTSSSKYMISPISLILQLFPPALLIKFHEICGQDDRQFIVTHFTLLWNQMLYMKHTESSIRNIINQYCTIIIRLIHEVQTIHSIIVHHSISLNSLVLTPQQQIVSRAFLSVFELFGEAQADLSLLEACDKEMEIVFEVF